MIGQRSAESDQPVPPALLPRKACLGEEFFPKLHIQPERSLGLTARTPRDRWSAPGRGGAPTPPNPAEAQDCYRRSSFADLAKVGWSVRSKMSASEPSIADPGDPARTARAASPTPPAAGARRWLRAAPTVKRPWSHGSKRSASRRERLRPSVSQRLPGRACVKAGRQGPSRRPSDGVSTAAQPWPH